MAKNYDVLDELVPKTVELHRAVFDKGYYQGYKDGELSRLRTDSNETYRAACEKAAFERGLDTAWECARKILHWGSIIQRNIFGMVDDIPILDNFTASEAIAKIKEYEEKQKQDNNKIGIGDEIISEDKS